jgi:hypothetical protein
MIRNLIAYALLAIVVSCTVAHAAEIVVRNDSIPPGEPVEIFSGGTPDDPGELSRAGVRAGSRLTVPVSGTLVGVQIAWGSVTGGAAPMQETAIRIRENGPEFYFPFGATLATIDSPTFIDGAINEFRYLDPATNLIPISIPVTAGASYFVDLEFGHAADHFPTPLALDDTSHIPSILADEHLLNPSGPGKSYLLLPYFSDTNWVPQFIVLSDTGEFAIRLIVIPVPEPSSLALIGLSAIGLAGYAWRVRKRTAGQLPLGYNNEMGRAGNHSGQMMRNIRFVLFTAIAVVGWATNSQAATFTITVGNYDLLPNTPGQEIPLYVTGIVPRADADPTTQANPGNVTGLILGAAINDGGSFWGGTPGPKISSIDVDSGSTIWVAPQSPFGHQAPNNFINTGQFAGIYVFTTQGYVNVTGGLFATLMIDTTGFNGGTYSLRLSDSYPIDLVFDPTSSKLLGYNESLPKPEILDVTEIIYQYYDGTAGQITIVPEPSSMVLAALGLIGLAAWGRRRKR